MSSRGFAGFLIPNLIAGLTSGLVTLVYSVSFAALIFSEKLADHFPQGIGTALIGATITAIIVAWRSPFPFTLAGPEANSAVVLALAARSIANALDSPTGKSFIYPTVWAAIALSTLLSGLFLYTLGRFRLGQFARYIPYPVIGGFLAGTGWLIARSSVKVMTGVPLTFADLPRLLPAQVAWQWIAGVAVAGILFVALARFRHFLALPILLVGGIALGNTARVALQTASPTLYPETWFFQPFSQKGVWAAWNYSTFNYIDWNVLYHQTGTLLAMVAIVMLSIILNSTGLELATSRNVDLNDELRAEGIANLANGVVGGMIGYISINRCLLNQRAGATSPLAGIVAGAVCGSVLLLGSSFLAYIPKPLLGGLLLYIGSNLMLRWVYHSRSKLPTFDYLLVLVILLIIATLGFLPGIAVGVLIACVLFIVSYGKTSSVRHQISGGTSHSNLCRSATQQEVLDREGGSIEILVLHGFVFFGTANDLLDRIRRRIADTASGKLRYLLFDFRLVTGLDSSAVLSFQKLAQLADHRGLKLAFAHVSAGIEAQLRQGGLHSTARFFADLDRAMEWSENEILREHKMLETPAVPLTDQLRDLLKNHEFAEQLLPYLRRVDLKEGQPLFRQGDSSDGLYFVESGRVSVVLECAQGAALRRRTYSGGTIVGEMGFFSGAPRSATVIADEPSRVHFLSKDAFEKLERNQPSLAFAFSKGIINLVADRLRRSEAEVRTLQQ